MNKEQDKERIEENRKGIIGYFKAIVNDTYVGGIKTYNDEQEAKRTMERFEKELTSFEHSIRTEVDKEWREKIKNVKYDYPKSENQKEHERNIDIIERTVNQIKKQLLQ